MYNTYCARCGKSQKWERAMVKRKGTDCLYESILMSLERDSKKKSRSHLPNNSRQGLPFVVWPKHGRYPCQSLGKVVKNHGFLVQLSRQIVTTIN